MNEVDLHCHTTASDGVLTPTQLVAHAGRLALSVIAITDHDSTEGIAEGQAAGDRYGVEVIPGVEINTDMPGSEVHVLGYFVNHTDADFSAELARLREGRRQRAEQMVDALAGLGAPISLSRVYEIAGDGAVGRPHVARALLEAGHIATLGEAFDRYIGRDGPAYVERLKFSPEDACALIRRAGGVPSLAHPVYFGSGGVIKAPMKLEILLPSLVDAGLMGLEVYYPGYDAVTTEYLMEMARRFGLLLTGGTDFHSIVWNRMDLGGIYVPMKTVRRLRAAWQELAG